MPEITLYVPDGVVPRQRPALVERQYTDSIDLLQERIAELEFAMEDSAWQALDQNSQREFSRDGLRKIINLSRISYLKNPIIRRGVDVQANYVFGQGIEFEAVDPAVNDVVQAFLDDAKNRAEFSGHQAMTVKEVDLACEGNVFFVYFSDASTGAVRLRSLPVDEVADVITNPEDRKEPWFYRRMWVEESLGRGGSMVVTQEEALYPDIAYNPRRKLPARGGIEIRWDTPVHHVKVGGLSSMKFGLPEVYPALDWARAYKNALEDDATRSAALARFAMKLTTTGSAATMAAAKAKLGTTYGNAARAAETNPPPVAGSTFIGRRDAQGNVITDIDPINLSGTTLPDDHARPIRLMALMAMGLPETFFSDAKVGNHATAKTLDRPTELMMVQRRAFWGDEYRTMLEYVVRKAIQAPGGPLRGRYRVTGNGDTQSYAVVGVARENGEAVDPTVKVSWPPLLEHDITETVGAIVQAATLGGSQAQGVFGEQELARMLLSAFGVKDIDEKITAWFGDQPDALPEPPAPPVPFGAPPLPGAPPPTPPVKEAWVERMVSEIAETLKR
jgi:hypothetical protein